MKQLEKNHPRQNFILGINKCLIIMVDPGRPVKDIELIQILSIEKIFEELSQSGGFESVNLSDGLEILTEMISDEQCLKICFICCSSSINRAKRNNQNMIKNKWFDVAITTCGALDHDIARHFSQYKEGSFTMDDMRISRSRHSQIRQCSSTMDSYGPLIEEKMQAFLEEEYQNGTREMSTAEICKMIGKHLGRRFISVLGIQK